MHQVQYALKEVWTEKDKQDKGFPLLFGLLQTFGAYQPHPPQCAHWGTFPKGEGMALPRQWNRRKINDHFSGQGFFAVKPFYHKAPLFANKSLPPL